MSSPFKFLDAYEQSDKDIFFGRTGEIEQLYRLLFEANLVLVYGQSGTGKTSLIQCGLANRFQPTDWFQLFVRRQEDINRALDREIRARALTEIPADSSAVEAVRSLYLDHLRPIYLIFDQFEELFILGSGEEQDAFITTIAALQASDVSCKIIISLREEYLAMLHRFEKAVPTLFNKRLRVEPMSMANLRQVIVGTTGALGIRLEHGDDTADRIIDNLNDPRAGVQLAYLQVYLDRLFRHATGDGAGGAVVFTDQAVEETGKLGDLMEDFLEEQTAAIQADLAGRHKSIGKDAVQHVLEEFTTLEGTKQPMVRAELAARLPALDPWIDDILGALQKARVLRCTDQVYELAHDSLAGRIADRRSGERKALLIVQKLVRDRMAAFDQTKTWLNREELAVVWSSRPRLELAGAEEAFVARSASKVRWRRIRRIGTVAATGLILLLMTVLMFAFSLSTQDTVARAHLDTDDLARSIIFNLQEVPGTSQVRANILTHAAGVNGNLLHYSLTDGPEDPAYWNELLQADLTWENGDAAAARQRYRELADEVRVQRETAIDDLLPRVKLRGLLLRLLETEEDQVRYKALLDELLDVLVEETGTDVIDFTSDINWACEARITYSPPSPHCPSG